ncbi:MAG: cob(I)yrinic acid a,c-diamide adenosyltransferase [Dissulfurimicrobium sp.]|uniref:cob(I)yrinic acid a,c-diamide adenosyltransferase n=1 Tax=Dissulfurimicrobium sp. TaxID=2022436 RepID=UPI004049ACE2
MKKRRYVHIYTGDGKGKTTAALGLVLRAIGAGWRVFFCQFLKEGEFSEIKALNAFAGQVIVRQYGAGRFVRGRPCEEDIRLARQGFSEIKEILKGCQYDMVVMDEVNVAMRYGLIGIDEMMMLLKTRPMDIELVLTGRWADEGLFKEADVVTEMRCIKHYYKKGVMARVGVER